MAAGRRPSRRCANRGAATTHSLARTSGWPLPPPPMRRKTAGAITGPASSSTTTETARGSNRGMIGIIPTDRLLPTTTPANRRAMFRIIRAYRRHLAMQDSRSPTCEIIGISHRLPITPANRRATCKTIRTGRLHPVMRASRSPTCEIIRTSPRLPIAPASRGATSRIIRIGQPPLIATASRPRPISRGIRPQTMLATGPIATVRLVRGRATPILCRL